MPTYDYDSSSNRSDSSSVLESPQPRRRPPPPAPRINISARDLRPPANEASAASLAGGAASLQLRLDEATTAHESDGLTLFGAEGSWGFVASLAVQPAIRYLIHKPTDAPQGWQAQRCAAGAHTRAYTAVDGTYSSDLFHRLHFETTFGRTLSLSIAKPAVNVAYCAFAYLSQDYAAYRGQEEGLSQEVIFARHATACDFFRAVVLSREHASSSRSEQGFIPVEMNDIKAAIGKLWTREEYSGLRLSPMFDRAMSVGSIDSLAIDQANRTREEHVHVKNEYREVAEWLQRLYRQPYPARVRC
ncbi:hypothetical protein JCM10207_007775 [Rhodosporidiobolus poonsookiae]